MRAIFPSDMRGRARIRARGQCCRSAMRARLKSMKGSLTVDSEMSHSTGISPVSTSFMHPFFGRVRGTANRLLISRKSGHASLVYLALTRRFAPLSARCPKNRRETSRKRDQGCPFGEYLPFGPHAPALTGSRGLCPAPSMSGSPIVAEAGTAIGVVCTTTSPREGGPNLGRLRRAAWDQLSFSIGRDPITVGPKRLWIIKRDLR